MNKLLICVLLVVLPMLSIGQNNILNAKTPDEIGVKTAQQKSNDNDKPLSYGYINDRDILWSRHTWEKIVLDERVNFPLYYPVDTNFIGRDRRSLFHVLTAAIRKGEISIYGDSYFNEKKEFKDIETSLQSQDISQAGINVLNDNGIILDPNVRPLDIDTTYNLPDFDQYVNTVTVGADNVSEYHVHGVWYFDTRQSEMRYRLVGIAPVTPDANFIDAEEGIELFWVYYPEVRDILHEAKAFNNLNAARPISFDHILNSRRFNGLIYKMDNVQGDREIERYIAENSLMQLLESDRLKEVIRNFEIDMWNY